MYGCAEWLGCGAPAAGAPPRSSVRACRGEGEDGVAFAAAVAAGARLHGALLEYREHHPAVPSTQGITEPIAPLHGPADLCDAVFEP